MYSKNDLVADLEKTLVSGFDVVKISKMAFNIHHNHCLENSESMNYLLFTLMAMEEGPEFELTESEFLDLIADVKAGRYKE